MDAKGSKWFCSGVIFGAIFSGFYGTIHFMPFYCRGLAKAEHAACPLPSRVGAWADKFSGPSFHCWNPNRHICHPLLFLFQSLAASHCWGIGDELGKARGGFSYLSECLGFLRPGDPEGRALSWGREMKESGSRCPSLRAQPSPSKRAIVSSWDLSTTSKNTSPTEWIRRPAEISTQGPRGQVTH